MLSFRRLPRYLALLLAAALLASACTPVHVYLLASDALGGRVPGSAGHASAQDYIANYMLAHGATARDGSTTTASLLETYDGGTNVVAQIAGTDLADEIVLVGAHYDHLADCDDQGGSSICNGATDNAAGTAIVLEVAAAIHDSGNAPRRTVMFALWDEEERGLLGSGAWIAQNPATVGNIVAYVNYDIQGANLLPSLANDTLAIGAESGGSALVDAVAAAGAGSSLDLSLTSIIFGQGRSDHARFFSAGVPTVFFGDATGPCYHTTRDTYDVLNGPKLDEQRNIGVALVDGLASGSVTPSFDGGAPLATFEDAVVIDDFVNRGAADFDLFTSSQQNQLLAIQADLNAIVADGPGAFDSADVNTLLGSSLTLVSTLASGTCDGFLD